MSALDDRVKRGVDVALASIGLVVAAVPMGAIALAVRSTMGKPVLFRQARPGRHGQIFTLAKFRTMRPPKTAADDDQARLTGLGRALRASSLDELPELVNVLRGEMSLVGPRPLLVDYLSLYTPEQARRHDVRPGLTGLAQISGRNATTWEDRLALDVWYVDNRTLRLDLQIMARTVGQVLGRRGITQDDHATMARFTGSPDQEQQ